MRGRLIARQPAQDHRLNHALAKIVGKTHPRRPHSRSVNDEAEINRFGNPPTNSIRSDTALSGGFKPLGRPLVDTFITEVSQDTWIYFPWDMALAFQPPINKAGA